MRRRTISVVLALVIWIGGWQGAAANNRPRLSHLASDTRRAHTEPTLFAPVSTVEVAWRHDTSIFIDHHTYCASWSNGSPFADGICSYWADGLHIGVYYEYRHVDAIHFYGAHNPRAPKYWRLLISWLPTGARLMRCRTVNPSDQGGPAHVCLYRYHYADGNTLIVALYPHPDVGGDQGVVERDLQHMGFAAVEG